MADSQENSDSMSNTEVSDPRKSDSPRESSGNSFNDDNDKITSEKESDNSSKSSLNSESTTEKSCDSSSKDTDTTVSSFQFCKSENKISTSGSKLKPSLLRPSQLSSVATGASSSNNVLQPSKFSNPFSKEPQCNLNENENSETDKKLNNGTDSTATQTKNDKPEPKFLVLGSTSKKDDHNVTGTNSCSSNTIASAISTPSFVFGQNLKERVAVTSDDASSEAPEKEQCQEEAAVTNENGSSELLFSNAAAACKSTSKTGLSLTEAAQEMEEANRSNKRKYSEVTLLTGEEDEINVLQINCKLFAYDKATSSWQERGRGSLRLNDKDDESRLVARTAGTQRLVLNTKIWPGMTAERAGQKSIRITAMDVQGDLKVFTIQAAPKEIEQLYNLLLKRLERAQTRQPKKLASEQ